MDKNETAALIQRYLKGECTPEEVAKVEAWYNEAIHKRKGSLPEWNYDDLQEEVLANLLQQSRGQKPKLKKQSTLSPTFIRIFPAAALCIAICAIAYYLYHPVIPHNNPGYNQATLTLADGTKINLDSAKAGIQIRDEDIIYNDGVKINSNIHHSTSITYNYLTTPKGGTYQVILEDGTKIWLNAQTTLKYPSRFSGNKREVEINGEAFFNVAQAKDQPFTVKSSGQEVLVLGTAFNVRAFSDENTIKTTLVNGAVQVSTLNPSTNAFITHQRLNPGQQAIVKNAKIEVTEADLESETGWKDGYFKLAGDLRSIMAQIGRWYNVEVVFEEGAPSNIELGGKLSRNKNLSLILNALTKTDHRIHFKLIEGRLHVMK